MADHFEEVIGLRVSALEARVTAEAESVQEHFAELREFITFSLPQQAAELRAEFRQGLQGLEERLERRIGGVEQRLGAVEQRLGDLEQRIEGVEQRLGSVEAQLRVTNLILSDILARLPERRM